MRRLGAIALGCAVSTGAASARGDEPPPNSAPYPTLGWIIPQLIPSPEWLISKQGGSFGLRWQLTPLLFSFGRAEGESELRAFIVEPIVRQAGSIELYASPEVFTRPPGDGSKLAGRVGLRTYLPLVERGDNLSFSFGTSYLRVEGQNAAAYELGVYTLFGILGLQGAYSPGLFGGSYLFTLSVRYF